MDANDSSDRAWLLLTHHLPPEPAYFRVKVHRRLDRMGAVALKNSVYVLPPGDERQEDFEWLRQEIERNGGTSSLCMARFLDPETDERLVEAFRASSASAYQGVLEKVRALREELMVVEDPEAHRSQLRAHLSRLRHQVTRVVDVDFFEAPGREAVEEALAEMERVVRGEAPTEPGEGAGTGDPPRGRTWVTRQGVKVDRIASAWLIKRFIDPDAAFAFVAPEGYRPGEGELRFDMYEGEFTHEGDACTFEVLVRRFVPDDDALVAVGEIVHDIDCKDEKFGRPEVAGVEAVLTGLTRICADDEERLAQGGAVFEELYGHFGV